MFSLFRRLKKKQLTHKIPLGQILDQGTERGDKTPFYMNGVLVGHSEYEGNGNFTIHFDKRQ